MQERESLKHSWFDDELIYLALLRNKAHRKLKKAKELGYELAERLLMDFRTARTAYKRAFRRKHKDYPMVLDNCGGISTMSPITKIFEAELAAQITRHYNAHDLLTGNQHGFRASMLNGKRLIPLIIRFY